MKFDVLTLFPDLITDFFKSGIPSKALEKKLAVVRAVNIRDYAEGKSKIVDDTPFGGGPGMVMKIDPIYRAVLSLQDETKQSNEKLKSKIIVTSVRGKKFNHKKAKEYAKLDQLIFICGRYDGIDERVTTYIADEEISVGDFVLQGGELSALMIIEAVMRFIPGVIGNPQSPDKLLGPQYTKPAVFSPKKGVEWKAPEVLLSGDHKKIAEWRKERGLIL